MSCKIKIENFKKQESTYREMPYDYVWICPSCYEEQLEFEEPELGQAVKCEDCQIIVEVVK